MIEALFWAAAGLIVFTHLGYPLVLALLVRLRRATRRGGEQAPPGPLPDGGTAAEDLPEVSLIIAAFDEEAVIAQKVRNALALDYPSQRLAVVVASDGSTDRTAELARGAGADLVLELPRGGKIAAQNAAVERTRGEILAFSDANSLWEPEALRRLVSRFSDPRVAYACGEVRFVAEGGENLEGAYWRYEMAVRELESELGGITAGNGAIYAVRRDAYLHLRPSGSHDLSFPFALAKRGLAAVYAPQARASEKMVPTLPGEFARKRRMMAGLWDIVVGERMLSPRGYSPIFAFQIASHRLLRYLSPFLHLLLLATNLALLGEGWVYTATLAVQLAVLLGAALAPALPLAPLRAARYYVLVTAAIAAGLWDRLRQGSPGAWEKAAGTR